jgi:uncharacterized membrane protein
MLFSAMFLVPGVFLLARFFYYYIVRGGQGGTGLIQSVVIGGVCVMVAVQMFVLGILADLLAANRTLIEDLLVRMRKLELPKSAPLQEDVVQDQKRHVG